MDNLSLEDQWIVDAIKASDHDHAVLRLLYKVRRQRDALDDLNRRAASRRFYLRIANELGHLPSREEFVTARDALTDEQRRDRLDPELVQ